MIHTIWFGIIWHSVSAWVVYSTWYKQRQHWLQLLDLIAVKHSFLHTFLFSLGYVDLVHNLLRSLCAYIWVPEVVDRYWVRIPYRYIFYVRSLCPFMPFCSCCIGIWCSFNFTIRENEHRLNLIFLRKDAPESMLPIMPLTYVSLKMMNMSLVCSLYIIKPILSCVVSVDFPVACPRDCMNVCVRTYEHDQFSSKIILRRFYTVQEWHLSLAAAANSSVVTKIQ